MRSSGQARGNRWKRNEYEDGKVTKETEIDMGGETHFPEGENHLPPAPPPPFTILL